MSEQATKDPAIRYAGFETVPLEFIVSVGRTRARVADLAALKPGDVIPLDRRIGEPFELRCDRSVLGWVELVADNDAIALKLVRVAEDDDASGR